MLISFFIFCYQSMLIAPLKCKIILSNRVVNGNFNYQKLMQVNN